MFHKNKTSLMKLRVYDDFSSMIHSCQFTFRPTILNCFALKFIERRFYFALKFTEKRRLFWVKVYWETTTCRRILRVSLVDFRKLNYVVSFGSPLGRGTKTEMGLLSCGFRFNSVPFFVREINLRSRRLKSDHSSENFLYERTIWERPTGMDKNVFIHFVVRFDFIVIDLRPNWPLVETNEENVQSSYKKFA